MMHFQGNPECPLIDTVFDSISEADTEDEFRELRAEFPDDYCSACAPGKGRTDSDRYAELRKLVEAWQAAHTASDEDRTTDQPEGWITRWMTVCQTEKALREWSHR